MEIIKIEFRIPIKNKVNLRNFYFFLISLNYHYFNKKKITISNCRHTEREKMDDYLQNVKLSFFANALIIVNDELIENKKPNRTEINYIIER